MKATYPAITAAILGANLLAGPVLAQQESQLSAHACEALAVEFRAEGVKLTSGSAIEAGSAKEGASLPAHCKITGVIDERVGRKNQEYAIKFQLLIPIEGAWNKKFIFVGGGGSNGSVRDGIAAPAALQPPLARGYAVLTQDSGHDNFVNDIPEDGGVRSFGLDYRARQDNSFRSYPRATEVAMLVLEAAYGEGPDLKYFSGCSEGGRQAMLVAQRYPEMFDGVIAGAPLLKAPHAALVRPAWLMQRYADLAREKGLEDRNGLPFLNKTFTDADLEVLRSGVEKVCDPLDGVSDGMSQNLRACQAAFDPGALLCEAGESGGCLTASQVNTLMTQMGGLENDVPWSWDVGIVGQMRDWWLGPWEAEQSNSFWIRGALEALYISPPPAVDLSVRNGSEAYRRMLDFDVETDMSFSI